VAVRVTTRHGRRPTTGASASGPLSNGANLAALARQLSRAGVRVVEVNRPDRAVRRRRGKTADGPAETLRLLKFAKDSGVKARTQAINQLKAVLVTADPKLRESASRCGMTPTRARAGRPGSMTSQRRRRVCSAADLVSSGSASMCRFRGRTTSSNPSRRRWRRSQNATLPGPSCTGTSPQVAPT
jgi:hypothetical protein